MRPRRAGGKMSSGDKIWIHSEKVYGEVISYGAHVSVVRYIKDKTVFETYLENEEFDIVEEIKYPEFWEEEN
jgi:hypothetical protein